MNTGVHPKASKSKLKADRPDRSNNFNCKNDGGKNASCCAGRNLLTSPGVADKYTFLLNTWNTLPESYQQRVYKTTLLTFKRQIQQVEIPMPAEVISVEAARVDNAMLLEYLTSEVALQEPDIGSTDPNIPVENTWMDEQLHFGMPVGRVDYEDQGDESDEHDTIPTASRWWRPATELETDDQGTSGVDGYESDDGGDADVNE